MPRDALSEMPQSRQRGWRLLVKTAADRTAGALGLTLAMPLLFAAAVGVRWSLGSPVLFVQERPGKSGCPFRIMKFRTMRDERDAKGRPLPDSERLTRFGRFLRAMSVDELPQLWNVVKGDLSLVGPRPLLMEYLDRYSQRQARRHDVLPGITGWAQVNGRNAITWEEKFALDVWYVENWSLALDMRILLSTIVHVLRREDVTNGSHATMPEFKGTLDSKSRPEEATAKAIQR